MTPISLHERRAAAVTVVASIGVFLALIVVFPPFYQTFDEAKYLGIGYNFVTGNGPRTLFGAIFLPHSPTWPALVVGPSVWFGIDPLAWGHILVALAGAALIALVAAFGWRVRPIVGGLAAAGLLAVPYVHDLSRTSRLDVPAAMLALAYVWVGVAAVRRGSFGWGLVAGATFALAFLVKEIVLPLAPVPFLFGLLERRAWPAILRAASGTVLVAAIGTSWWFVLYAEAAHRVYRLGTPAWTLGVLAILGLVFVVGGYAARWISTRRGLPELPARASLLLGWGLAIAWTAAFVVFFDRSGELRGRGLFQPSQWSLYLETWLPGLRAVVYFGIVGVALAIVAWRRAGPARAGYDLLFVSTLCSVPLVLFVIALGEPPRDYLAQIGLLVGLAAAGWFSVVEWLVGLVRGRSRTAGPRMPLPAAALIAGCVAAVVVGSAVLATHALAFRESATGDARAAAVRTTTDWIKANVPSGSHLGFGEFLAYEMALELRGRYAMATSNPSLVVANAGDPLGFGEFGQPTITDWIAVEAVSRRTLEFQAFRGSTFGNYYKGRATRIFVFSTGAPTSVPSLVPALTPDHGFTQLAHFDFPQKSRAGVVSSLDTYVFAVDPGRIDFTASPVYMTPDALAQLLDYLATQPRRAAVVATNLLTRIQLTGDPAKRDALLVRLAAMARG